MNEQRASERAAHDLQSVLGALWERARPLVMEYVETIEDATSAWLEGRLDEETRAAGERSAHKVAGTAGTYGYPRASDLARALEALFAEAPGTDPAAVVRAAELVNLLRRDIGKPAPTGSTQHADDRTRLLVVHEDEAQAGHLRVAAAARGVHARAATSLATAREYAEAAPPDVVLVDLSLVGGDPAGLMAWLDAMESHPSVVVLSRDEHFVDRVECSRAGVHAFVSQGLGPERIVEAALTTLDEGRSSHRVLAVDDDPAMLSALSAVFAEQPIELTTLGDPVRFGDVLTETTPDLLILNVDMPEVSGVELCRLVRADVRWRTLPVLVLTAKTDTATVRAVFDAGADDYVSKPVLGPELLNRVRNRLERVQLFRQLAETDPLTGLCNRRKFDAELQRLAAMATRYDEPLSFALLDLDRFKDVNDRYGHSTGDAVLQRLAALLATSFRPHDLPCRWGGEEFAVAMYGMARDDGVARLASLLESFRGERFATGDGTDLDVTFSAGVAQHGLDGEDTHALYRRADEALMHAKESGRDRVLPAGWRPDADPSLVDVALIEDDPSLVSLLRHTLVTRGYRTAEFTDGVQALEELTGPGRRRPRVILLDVDLPGMSGLDVLLRLAHEGVLHDTRVILLTARTGEAEVVKALETGAFDHVAKPFSVPVLMQRVRRALAA